MCQCIFPVVRTCLCLPNNINYEFQLCCCVCSFASFHISDAICFSCSFEVYFISSTTDSCDSYGGISVLVYNILVGLSQSSQPRDNYSKMFFKNYLKIFHEFLCFLLSSFLVQGVFQTPYLMLYFFFECFVKVVDYVLLLLLLLFLISGN